MGSQANTSEWDWNCQLDLVINTERFGFLKLMSTLMVLNFVMLQVLLHSLILISYFAGFHSKGILIAMMVSSSFGLLLILLIPLYFTLGGIQLTKERAINLGYYRGSFDIHGPRSHAQRVNENRNFESWNPEIQSGYQTRTLNHSSNLEYDIAFAAPTEPQQFDQEARLNEEIEDVTPEIIYRNQNDVVKCPLCRSNLSGVCQLDNQGRVILKIILNKETDESRPIAFSSIYSQGEKSLCFICCSAEANALLLDCTHGGICFDCGKTLLD